MKYEEYVKPELEELELELEGSFLASKSGDTTGVPGGGDFEEGDEWD